MTTERERLRQAADGEAAWKRWGPYLSERAWGTVREDYSANGDAWEFFTHDQARSRVYRWNEDGMAGLCDREQRLCLSFAFWNGKDPFLKERMFGLSGSQGNHGEDVKEYWFYVDSTPTHSWMVWRYFYPQSEFPYEDLVAENARRGKLDPEYELIDTGVFDDDRYWDIRIEYAKGTAEDYSVRVHVRNAGPDTATLDVLPTLWFRNTWSWGTDDRPKPEITGIDNELHADHYRTGRRVLAGEVGPDGRLPELLFCENENNNARLWGTAPETPYPKDGINDHVVHGSPTVNLARVGTKAALRYKLTVAPGETAVLRIRLADDDAVRPHFGVHFDELFDQRKAEADEFYAELTPDTATDDEALVMRQAFAGMLWCKQFYNYNVAQWLSGDPAGPVPPEERKEGRNHTWHHINNYDVISMPDSWEYPWYATWDLGFHCVTLAHVDAEFAKKQLLLFLREWYLHPNGQLPAYEWALDDVNPPVHAWAALRVFQIDGSNDYLFLEQVFQKLLMNFTWWVNRKDVDGNNVFGGGFLGLDNIGLFDRSQPLPGGIQLEQADGTSWMGFYALNMLNTALILATNDAAYEGIASKFFEHFGYIASAINGDDDVHGYGLWDEEDGFYYDVVQVEGEHRRLPVRSMVGLSPLYATEVLGPVLLSRFPGFSKRKRWFLRYRNQDHDLSHLDQTNERGAVLLSMVSPARLRRLLEQMLDPEEFLSDHGVRAVSAFHREEPCRVDIEGMHYEVDYEPAESRSGLFGGNSNWRGPVWFPVNYLIVESLREYNKYVGPDFRVEHPAGSGNMATLAEVADDLTQRLVSIFLQDDQGRRPVFGGVEKFHTDPAWRDVVLFFEYYHGDTGAGLGASHQTGWTGLVADLITRRRWTHSKAPVKQGGAAFTQAFAAEP
jgi:hypothetical protein